MPPVPQWHGTTEEKAALDAILQKDCKCVYTAAGFMGMAKILTAKCAQHLLLDDQKAIDRLVFYRRIRMRLKLEERRVKKCATA